jgi:hypothetical protein
LHDTGDGGVMRKSVMWTVDAGPPPADVGGAAAVVVVDPRDPFVVGIVDAGVVERTEVVDVDSTAGGLLVVVDDDEP